MSLWFRLISTLVFSFLQKRALPSTAFQMNFIIGPTEADLILANNSRYFGFMEVARLNMMIRTGAFMEALKRRWVPLVASQTIRYKRPLKRFQKVSLRSQIVYWDGKWFFVEHIFQRNGKLIAAGIAKACFRGKDGVIPPEEMFKILGLASSSPSLPLAVAKWQESETAQLSALNEGL